MRLSGSNRLPKVERPEPAELQEDRPRWGAAEDPDGVVPVEAELLVGEVEAGAVSLVAVAAVPAARA